MRWRLVVGCWFLLLGYSRAQDRDSSVNSEKAVYDKRYFKSYITDTKGIVVAPFHWNGKQWLTAGSILVIGGVTLTQDLEIRKVFQRNRSATADDLSKYFFEPAGRFYIDAAGLALFYTGGLIFKNERAKRIAMEATKTLLISGAVNQSVKYLVQRHRPDEDVPADPYKAEGFLHGRTGHYSFYSGHSSNAFALATIFSMEYKEKKWVPYVAYTIATGTALSRIYDDKHWASDVFIGAASGYFMARFIYKKNNWGIKRQTINNNL